jgi:SAM-dependent methyltransferase
LGFKDEYEPGMVGKAKHKRQWNVFGSPHAGYMMKKAKKYLNMLLIGANSQIKKWEGPIEFMIQFKNFKKSSQRVPRFQMFWKERYPILGEKTTQTNFDTHYIYHPAWAARILAQVRPSLHIDISSSLHFCTMLSAFIPVQFYDYRPAKLRLSGLESNHGDLMHLPFSENSIESLSCMHVVEHIGLGRYGDPLDPDGDLKAIAELKRVLRKGGSLIFVVPVGQPKIRFNAHRIYSYEQIISYFPGFQIEQFALIDDLGELRINAEPGDVARQKYGCGCWHFVKY